MLKDAPLLKPTSLTRAVRPQYTLTGKDGAAVMTEEPATYAPVRCPRREFHGCMTVRCERDVLVQGCPGRADCHEHTICARSGFEWISAGQVLPALRTPEQMAISIGAAFEEIVGRRQSKRGHFGKH
jgi:hypothetical protein